MEIINNFFNFVKKSPVSYIAVKNAEKMLIEKGYKKLSVSEKWELQNGGKYYLINNSTCVIAFRINKLQKGAMIVSSHTDSPSFYITPNGQTAVQGKYTKLSVEKYGGMIYSSWLDRPLSVAGRVTVKTENGIEEREVLIDDDLVIIPSVAIHLDKNANKDTNLNPAVDMQPLYSVGNHSEEIKEKVAKNLNINADDIVSTDLYLYNRQSPCLLGANKELIGAPRLDDMECVYSSIVSFLNSDDTDSIPVLVLFDNEEVGSMTTSGAGSRILKDTLDRVLSCLDKNEEEKQIFYSNSFMVSADNAHAIHPNHPEFSNSNNAPVINGGVVIKFNANRRYTTDSLSCAVFAQICDKAKVPYQYYCNRADLPGGSTLGNISLSQLTVPTVDVGLAQLSMHSSFETAGREDLENMIKALTAFYSSSITRKDDLIVLK